MTAGGAAHLQEADDCIRRLCYECLETAMMRIGSAEGDGDCCRTLRGAGRGGLVEANAKIGQHRAGSDVHGDGEGRCRQSKQTRVGGCSCCDGRLM